MSKLKSNVKLAKPFESIKAACEARKYRSEFNSNTREEVKKLLLETKMTQQQMADKLGVSQPTVQRHIQALAKAERDWEEVLENVEWSRQQRAEQEEKDRLDAIKRTTERLAAHRAANRLKPTK